MKSAQALAAFAAALLVAAFPGSGSAGVSDFWGRAVPKACTPEAQRCLEKLEARILLMGRNPDGVSIDQALLELHQTDPVCALLLEGRLRDL
jgi:type 1 fimbria pilin